MNRVLRIAASAFFGLGTVALIVLWVWSYWWWEEIYQGPLGKHVLSFHSSQGELGIGYWNGHYKSIPMNIRTAAEPLWPWAKGAVPLSTVGIRWDRQSGPVEITRIVIPFWLPVLMAVTIAAVPWIRHIRRFSLRALIITITLVAIVLGLVCYSIR